MYSDISRLLGWQAYGDRTKRRKQYKGGQNTNTCHAASFCHADSGGIYCRKTDCTKVLFDTGDKRKYYATNIM